MKKCFLPPFAAALCAVALGGCSRAPTTTLTLWAGPVGDFAQQEALQSLADAFEDAYPTVAVEVQCMDVSNSEAALLTAQQDGTAPDLIFDSSERLLRAAQNGMVLADMQSFWSEQTAADIAATSTAIAPACQDGDGVYRVYPLSVMVDCMAINRELFDAAGATDLIGEDRLWTTQDFRTALRRLADNDTVPMLLFSGGISGDQGTRMLAQNLHDTAFTDAAHSRYTFGGEVAVQTLGELLELHNAGLLRYDNTANAADELRMFSEGHLGMTLCWNAANAAGHAGDTGFTPYAVAFPSDSREPSLYGTVWGFAMPETGDAARSAAARDFISFICDGAQQGPAAVRMTGQLPVRASFGDVWAQTPNAARMAEFAALLPYMGDCYGVTPNWGAQRVAWRDLLENAFLGESVELAVQTYESAVR